MGIFEIKSKYQYVLGLEKEGKSNRL